LLVCFFGGGGEEEGFGAGEREWRVCPMRLSTMGMCGFAFSSPRSLPLLSVFFPCAPVCAEGVALHSHLIHLSIHLLIPCPQYLCTQRRWHRQRRYRQCRRSRPRCPRHLVPLRPPPLPRPGRARCPAIPGRAADHARERRVAQLARGGRGERARVQVDERGARAGPGGRELGGARVHGVLPSSSGHGQMPFAQAGAALAAVEPGMSLSGGRSGSGSGSGSGAASSSQGHSHGGRRRRRGT
jgi:hypothetical protein